MARQVNSLLSEYKVGGGGILSQMTLRDVVETCYHREIYPILGILLILGASSGMFSELTAERIRIEMSGLGENPLKRWQAIGLYSAPTIAEVTIAIN